MTQLVIREPELRLVQDQRDLVRVEASQGIYSVVSFVRVSCVNGSVLMVGDGCQMNSLPPALQAIRWSAGPLPYLGGYLSAIYPSPLENWQDLEARVGEALVLNQLVLSMLWHRLNTLSPVPGILARLQRMALEFFWENRTWSVSAARSMSSTSRSCRDSFMVQVVWHAAHWHTPSSAASEGSDTTGSSFFSIRGVLQDLSKLLVFYQDLLRTCKLFSATRSVVATEGADLLAEPLLHDPPI
ncbi:unnamed protein product, partial [Lepidochelys olivacea]